MDPKFYMKKAGVVFLINLVTLFGKVNITETTLMSILFPDEHDDRTSQPARGGGKYSRGSTRGSRGNWRGSSRGRRGNRSRGRSRGRGHMSKGFSSGESQGENDFDEDGDIDMESGSVGPRANR